MDSSCDFYKSLCGTSLDPVLDCFLSPGRMFDTSALGAFSSTGCFVLNCGGHPVSAGFDQNQTQRVLGPVLPPLGLSHGGSSHVNVLCLCFSSWAVHSDHRGAQTGQ